MCYIKKILFFMALVFVNCNPSFQTTMVWLLFCLHVHNVVLQLLSYFVYLYFLVKYFYSNRTLLYSPNLFKVRCEKIKLEFYDGQKGPR